MATTYTVSFEQIQLLSGLAPDQAVYLAMVAKAYDAATPDQPFWTDSLGGTDPNDANAPDAGPAGRGVGLYAKSLPEGQIVRSDGDYGPTFTLNPFDIEDDQIFELAIVMAPDVFFSSVKVPASNFDKFLVDLVTTGVGSFGGVWGAVGGALLGWFGLGADDDDVTVPCYNVVIMARHVLTGAQLGDLAGQFQQQFGPRGPDPSYGCQRIDSFYWLSARTQYSFGTTPPVKKGDCELNPDIAEPAAPVLIGIWGDIGDPNADCVRVQIWGDHPDRLNVWLWDEGRTGDAPAEYNDVPITLEPVKIPFQRNLYSHADCPARTPKPVCPQCASFTNLDYSISFHDKALIGAAYSGSHVGTRPFLPFTLTNDVPRSCCEAAPSRLHALEPPTHRDHHAASDATAPRPVVRGFPLDTAIKFGDGTRLFTRGGGTYTMFPAGRSPFELVTQAGLRPMATTLRLSATLVLYLYGEFNAQADAQCHRLRYLKTNDAGKMVCDAMLQHDLISPN